MIVRACFEAILELTEIKLKSSFLNYLFLQ